MLNLNSQVSHPEILNCVQNIRIVKIAKNTF